MTPQDAQWMKASLCIAATALKRGLDAAPDGPERGQAQHGLLIVTGIAAMLGDTNAIPADAAEDAAQRQQLAALACQLGQELGETAAPAARSIDVAALLAFLQQHPLGGPALRLDAVRALPGGRSKLTLLGTLSGAKALPGDIVIRQDWAGSVVGTSVPGEFEVLQRLYQAGVKVPRPLLLEAGSAALGAPFIVVERRSGRSLTHQYAAPASASLVLQLADQLGHIHALETTMFEGLPGIGERGPLRPALVGFAAIIDKLETPSSPLVQAALQALEQTADRVQGPRTLVHGDLCFHNCMCDGDELTAVLDWELVHLGNPALDLGYLRVAAEQRVDWAEFMRRYHAAGGPALDAFSVDWYSLYGIVWFHHMVLQAKAGIRLGAVHDIEVASVCADVGPQALAHMGPALQRLREAKA